jgi:phosphatidylserine decarboxylase
MGTNGGHAFFLNEKVNAHIKEILCAWGAFLKTPGSCETLNDDPELGWFGRNAMADLKEFALDFECNPELPHYGFSSWDSFFTRRFRPGRRPVDSPSDSSIVCNPCESAPYKISRNAKLLDKFWVKGQRYSLKHILKDDSLSPSFVGGTIYQAFLSALSYHRWHCPVDGTVVKTYNIDGTYFSESESAHFDEVAPNTSQGYLVEVATRAVVVIQADDPLIGLLCFVAVGMVEVSSCEVVVTEGQRLRKGDELGMFHFGGSTFCLIFQEHVNIEFKLRGQQPGIHSKNIPVNSVLGVVEASKLHNKSI